MIGANAYWSIGEGFADMIGLTVSLSVVYTTCRYSHEACLCQTIRLALRYVCTLSPPGAAFDMFSSVGMCPGTALGFFWALGGTHID